MRKVGFLLIIVLLLALVPAVLAGGWAVITLDEAPGNIEAGKPWMIGFTVLQHGQTPVHKLDVNSPIEPELVATNLKNGQRVVAQATPTEEIGHFVVEVTFPSEGEWEWTIYPTPLAGDTVFEPLTVLPAVQPAAAGSAAAHAVATVPAVEDGPPISVALRWGALALALAAVALFVLQGRRREAVGAKS
jgi:hypothetical protein